MISNEEKSGCLKHSKTPVLETKIFFIYGITDKGCQQHTRKGWMFYLDSKNKFSIVMEYLCLHFSRKKELANFL